MHSVSPSLRLSTLPLLVLVSCCGLVAHAQNNETGSEARPSNLPDNINTSFLDPNMSVDKYVKRFEVESREVFLLRKELVAACQIEPGMEVADIGSGTGLFVPLLSKEAGTNGLVFAVDIAPKFAKHIRQKVREAGLSNVRVVLCSDRNVGIPKNSLDRAFICDVYHHFEFPQTTMKTLLTALRPGGQLILVDFERIEGKSREFLLNHVRAPKEVFKQEVIDAGFKFVEELSIKGLKENYVLRFIKPEN